jgi:hypothetical protein
MDPVRAGVELTKDWTIVEGEHFVVVHPPGKDAILVPYLLEALEAQRVALRSALGIEYPGKVRVEILDGARSLSLLTGLTEAEIRTSGTVAVAKYDKLMLISPRMLVKGYDWLDTAAHELVHHAITWRTRDRMPVWLHEGIAKWGETLWRAKGGEAYSPYAAARLEAALKKGALVTFDEMHPSVAKLSSDRATLAFAEVLLAVEHLLLGRSRSSRWCGTSPTAWTPARRWRRRPAAPGQSSRLAGARTWESARCRAAASGRGSSSGSATTRRRAPAGRSGRRSRTSGRGASRGWASSSASAGSGPPPGSSTARGTRGPGRSGPSSPTSTRSP